MKNKIFIVVFFLLLAFKSESQSYKYMYYLDKQLNTVPQNEAVFIGKAYEYNGYLRLDCFLKTTGKMVVTASVKDSTLGTLHDLFRTYHNDMSIESEGNYFENDMDGVWKYWDKKGFITDSVIYKRGVRIAYGAYKYSFYKPTLKQLLVSPELKDTLAGFRYSFTDSLKNTFTQQEVSIKDGKERVNFEADFIGDRGLLKEYDSTGVVKADSIFSRKLEEASFIGGDQAWRDFLRKNLNANVPAENYAPDGKYTVIVKFIINADGTLSDIKAENDPGYGMGKEAIRVIKKSNKWQPANKYGTYVKAYRRQPITFLIERSVR